MLFSSFLAPVRRHIHQHKEKDKRSIGKRKGRIVHRKYYTIHIILQETYYFILKSILMIPLLSSFFHYVKTIMLHSFLHHVTYTYRNIIKRDNLSMHLFNEKEEVLYLVLISYYVVLYFVVLYCIVLYYIVSHSIVLHDIIITTTTE